MTHRLHHSRHKRDSIVFATLTIHLKDGSSLSVVDRWDALLTRIEIASTLSQFAGFTITEAKES